MANRYWVGGTASWDATAGSKWSTTSGGAGGSAVPTAADDVYFDLTSGGAITVTVPTATTVTCRSLNFVDGTGGAYTGTFAFASTSAAITIGDATAGAGNVALKLSSGMTLTLTGIGSITYATTSATQQTITTNGKTVPNSVMSGANLDLKLSDAYTSSGSFTLGSGAGAKFDTGNFNITSTTLASANSTTRTLTLGSTIWTMTSTNTPLSVTSTNLTLNAGTSKMVLSPTANPPAWGSGLTWYDVQQDGAGLVIACNSLGLSCRNYTRTGTAVKTDGVTLQGNITCSGAFTVTGNSTVNRVFVQSSAPGTARTVSAATSSLTNVDFQDITASGAASPFTGTSIGDCLGNTNITYTTAAGTSNGGNGVNRYWVGNSANGDVTTSWSTSSGGASGASVPLPQDDIYFDVNSFNAIGQRAQLNMPQLCRNFDTTGTNRATTTIGTGSGTPIGIFGNMTYAGTAVDDANATGTVTYYGRGSQTLTNNGGTRYGAQTFTNPGGTYTIQDAYTTNAGTRTVTFNYGTFDANGKNLSHSVYTVNSTFTKLYMRSGTFTSTRLTSASSWQNLAAASVIDCGTSTITWDGNQTGTQTFAGGGATYNIVAFNQGTNPISLVISGANTIDTLTVGAGKNLVLTSAVQQTVRVFNGTGQNYGYQRFSSQGGCYASIPDSAATSWSGDFDLRFKFGADAWNQTNMVLAGKQTTNSTGYAWVVSFNASSKTPVLSVSSSGTAATAATSSAAVSFSDGSTDSWLRVTWRASDGRTQFFTSTNSTNNPSTPTWTQLGTNQTAAVGSIFDSPASILIGAQNTSNTPVCNGKFYRFQARNNILDDGTGIQLDVDFTSKAFGADTFTESSSNAATVTINGAQGQAGDGRVLVNSSTPGTAATLALTGAVNTLDYQTVKDITSVLPYKYYAGVNSIDKTNNTSIIFTAKVTQPYVTQVADAGNPAAGTSTVSTLTTAATAGNLLVVYWMSPGDPSTITAPSGYTLALSKIQGTSTYIYIWYKIASGGETNATVSWVTSRTTTMHLQEIAGWTGTPTLDVTDSNSSASSLTTLSTGAGVSNTTSFAYAVASVAGNGGIGATTAIPTNSYHEDLLTPAGSVNQMKVAGKPLTATASQTTTFTWTTSRVPASVLAIFKDVVATSTGGQLLLMGVGT